MYGVWRAEIIKGNSMTRRNGTPWVARLAALDEQWGFRREFVRGVRDYTYGKEHHTRGVYLYFALAPGMYETHRPISWKHDERQFVRVDDDGEMHVVSREEVVEWLRSNTSESAS